MEFVLGLIVGGGIVVLVVVGLLMKFANDIMKGF